MTLAQKFLVVTSELSEDDQTAKGQAVIKWLAEHDPKAACIARPPKKDVLFAFTDGSGAIVGVGGKVRIIDIV